MGRRLARSMRPGQRVEESGFFTGLAELRNGRWQFRDAHWSVIGIAAIVMVFCGL